MSGSYRWNPDGTQGEWVEGAAKPANLPQSAALPAQKLATGPVPAITPALLTKLGWRHAAALAPAMDLGCRTYGIVTRRSRLIDFLAQTGHESGRGMWLKEIWGPTAAQKRYEGRADLGNIHPGDGYRFMGRGLIQITGRENYEEAALGLGRPLDRLPAWLETPEGAAISAAWWWFEKGCNALSDAGDFLALTRKINGGLNGLKDRQERRREALAALA